MAKIKTWLGKFARWQYFGLLVLVLAYLILHLSFVTQPNRYIFDEEHYILDGRRIINEYRTERGEHPPLAKVIIAKGMEYIGDNPWGWRLPAIATSSLGIIVFYGIARRLKLSHRVAYLATFLFAFENLAFIHGGMAMLDIYLEFFTLLAFWFYLKGPAWWWAAAISGALAALSKFSGVLVFVAIGLHWGYTERRTVRTFFRQLAEVLHLRKAAPAVPAAEGTDMAAFLMPKPSFLDTYGRALIFVCSMLLAPVAFILLYWVFDYVIWGQWINVLNDIKTALTGTESIKFTGYTAPLPSRPWEWLLSPTNSFKFYQWLVKPGSVDTFILPYAFEPHISGMMSPTLWLSTLAMWPYIIWRAMKRRLWVILPVIWFVGVGLIPTLLRGHASNLVAAAICAGWLAIAAGLIFFMKDPPHDDKAAVFIFCWLVGTWVAWIPLDIITDRVSFSFYYLPSVGALALGAALLLERLLAKAEARPRGKLKDFLMFTVGGFLLAHLIVFGLIAPVKLPILIPAALLVLFFSLDYLGMGWRFLVATGVAVGGWLAIMRYYLYQQLLRWFGADIVAGGYPMQGMVWLVGILASLAILIALFTLTYWLLWRLTPKRAPVPVEAGTPPEAQPETSAEGRTELY